MKTGKPVPDGIRSKKKKGKNNFTTPKHESLEEQVREENVGNFKDMNSLAS